MTIAPKKRAHQAVSNYKAALDLFLEARNNAREILGADWNLPLTDDQLRGIIGTMPSRRLVALLEATRGERSLAILRTKITKRLSKRDGRANVGKPTI